MSLQQWAENKWLRPHQSSAQEIGNLFAIAERDLDDAKGAISADWRFNIAYNAALQLCTILMHASGYRPEKNLAHFRTLAALPLILGPEHREDAAYLDACRSKRNVVEYDRSGAASETDAEELIAYVQDLRTDVLSWLRANHPELLSKPSPGKK